MSAFSESDRTTLRRELARMVEAAGQLVSEVYATDFTVQEKGPNDPVTTADHRANTYLCDELARLYPGIPIVAEESDGARYAGFQASSAAFFVDPLDGTREFVAKNGEFVVMVGLAENGRAIAGAIHAPVRKTTWVAVANQGAFERSPTGERKLTIADVGSLAETRWVVSRSRRSPELDQLLASTKPGEVIPMGSAGLKAASVARGDADLYVQLGRAGSLWDLCAADAIITAAGGVFTDQKGNAIDYRSADIVVRGGLIAGGPRAHEAVLAALGLFVYVVTMRDHAEVVIVGGGIMGLAIAYNLARRHGVTDVTVVDQSYLCGGASGRNGGGIRAQWSSESNVRLMQESLRICSEFAEEMKINVWFRRGGYLFLVRSEEKRRALEQSVAVQNAHGVETRMLSAEEARKVVPELDVSTVVAASHNPNDAVVFPWPFVWGYADGAKKLGVDIATHTKVTGFRTTGKRIDSVLTDRGEIRTNTVINATGAWAPEIARMLGVELPNKPHRHEICSTEPLKPWLSPLVADLSDGLYFSQSTRGEIVGGISNEHVPPGIDMRSSHDFLRLYSRSLTRSIPMLGAVKVLRQWAGCYDLTPDANPIVGEVDDMERFFQVSGFMGHGFMMAPIIGRLMAEQVAEGTSLPMFERWNLRRFKEGKLLSEAMIIG